MKKTLVAGLLAIVCCLPGFGEVPRLLNYQGRIQVGTQNFDGPGQFKFALVNAAGTVTYWSNDGTSSAGSEPTAGVVLPVVKGLYSVVLGDSARPNMTAMPADAFSSGEVFLRIWFNNGAAGFQRMLPDQRIAAVGFSIQSANADFLDGLDSTFFTAKFAEAQAKLDNATSDLRAVNAELDAKFSFQISGLNSALTAKDVDLQTQVNAIKTEEAAAHALFDAKLNNTTQTLQAATTDVKNQLQAQINAVNSALQAKDVDLQNEVNLLKTVEADLQNQIGQLKATDVDLQNQINDAKTSDTAAHAQLNTKIDSTAATLQAQINNVQAIGSLIQFGQGSGGVTYNSVGEVKNIDEIAVVVPAAGYLFITGFVNAYIGTFGNAGGFAFILYDATSGQVELTRAVYKLDTLDQHNERINPSVSWVLPVSGPKTVTLRTQGVFEYGATLTTYAHNLTAIYIPGRAQ
jgi:hypothetical protein